MKNFIRKNIRMIAIALTLLSLILVVGISLTQQKVNSIIDKTTIISKDNKCSVKDNLKAKDEKKVKITNATSDRVLKAKANLDKTLQTKLIGELKIPSVNIKLPIFKGMTDDTLLNGVGTYDAARKMGTDNYVMMAHNLPLEYKDALLQPLIDIKIDDEIEVSNFSNKYIYKVTYKGIVDQSEVGILGHTDASMVTIFRCVGAAGSTKRLVVQGQLVDALKLKKPVNCDTKKETKKINNISNDDKTTLNVAKSTMISGTTKSNWLQYLLAMIPGISGVSGFATVNRKKNN